MAEQQLRVDMDELVSGSIYVRVIDKDDGVMVKAGDVNVNGNLDLNAFTVRLSRAVAQKTGKRVLRVELDVFNVSGDFSF